MTTFKSRSRFLRLLPGVALVCTGLLVLKTSGLVHDAFAVEGAPAAGDATAPAPQSVNQDFAGSDAQMNSASEVDVLTSLSKRRAAMDARETEIQAEANVLAATEARVDAKIAQLKQLQASIAGLLTQRDTAQEKQVAALVKTYSAMKPKDAAGIFNSLDDSVLLPVAEEMKSDVLAPVLAAMTPEAARKLTMKLASKLTLPDTAEAMAPVTAASGAAQAPAPAAQASQPKAASSGAPVPQPKPKS
jgi:flagellar motility protein MotE (MotC chaperone)